MYPIHLPRDFLMNGNWLSSSNNFVSNHRILRCENVVKQTMCLITWNALVRVSHQMVSFSELLQHFNFLPKSNLVFLCRRFSLLTMWSFSKPWWDCDLLCWSRTSWRVQVWVTITVVFSTIFLCVRSALVPWTDIKLKKNNNNKPSSSQFSHCSKRGLIIPHVYFVFLVFSFCCCCVFLFCFVFFRRMLF